MTLHIFCFVFQSGPTIPDDEDGHLSYKLGDVIENDSHRCKLTSDWMSVNNNVFTAVSRVKVCPSNLRIMGQI